MKEVKPKKPQVSVIIPSYNSQRHIEKCLMSVLSQKTEYRFEVIVVDSSTDATPAIITAQFPTVKLIHLDKQTYPGAGRNIGVQHAQGDIIAFIDSDCVADENWLERAISSLCEHYSFVGGGVKNGNPHSSTSKVDFWLTFNEFTSAMPHRNVTFMPTCNFVCTKNAFLEIGGFDPHLLAGEDTLFCLKASTKYALLFNPGARVSHMNRTALTPFLKHHHSFGKHSAFLRQNFELPGNTLSQYALLSFGAPLAKYARISRRMIQWNKDDFWLYLLLTPLVLAGVGAWGAGFIQTSFMKKV